MAREKSGCGCGCVTTAVGLIVGLIFTAAILWFVLDMIKSNEPYKGALERAGANPAVVKITGEPLEGGLYILGTVNVSGTSGSASFNAPVSGPKNAGTLYVEATKSAGQWSYHQLAFESDGGKRIDLLGSQSPQKLLEAFKKQAK